MIIGQYKSKLTDKDRILVPKKFREELGDEMVVAKWYEHCLVLVSHEKWSDLQERLMGMSKLVISPVRDIDRFILGSAYEVKLDKQGRFIVPTLLIDYASISNEVVFVGLGDRVEIWSDDLWTEIQKDAEKDAAHALEKIAEIS